MLRPPRPASEYRSLRVASCEYGISSLYQSSLRLWLWAFLGAFCISGAGVHVLVDGYPSALRPHGPGETHGNEVLRRQGTRRPVIPNSPKFEISRGKYTKKRLASTYTLKYYGHPPRPLISRAKSLFAVAPMEYFGRSDLHLVSKNRDPFIRYSISPGSIALRRMVSTFTFYVCASSPFIL